MLSAACVCRLRLRDLKFEYSQLESDSGEAYNLHCYLWQDSKAAMREGPQDIMGAKQLYQAQAGSANVGGVEGLLGSRAGGELGGVVWWGRDALIIGSHAQTVVRLRIAGSSKVTNKVYNENCPPQ